MGTLATDQNVHVTVAYHSEVNTPCGGLQSRVRTPWAGAVAVSACLPSIPRSCAAAAAGAGDGTPGGRGMYRYCKDDARDQAGVQRAVAQATVVKSSCDGDCTTLVVPGVASCASSRAPLGPKPRKAQQQQGLLPCSYLPIDATGVQRLNRHSGDDISSQTEFA
jgi:hypothetical protein